jgi:septal ring factor EnvC (AmiA/AmiB activator)
VVVVGVAVAASAAAERPTTVTAQIESATNARDIIAEKIEPRRAQSRARVLALYRSSSAARSIFNPDNRWRRARARADLVRVLRRDLAELEALEGELRWVSRAAGELGKKVAAVPEPELLRPVDGAPVVLGFGAHHPAHRLQSVRSGVFLATTSAASIRAPVAGRIVYSGEVAGLGETAVIESEGHWITMGPLALERPLGAEVDRGEALGRPIGDRLFVELRRIDRRGGVPLDPRPFKSGSD